MSFSKQAFAHKALVNSRSTGGARDALFALCHFMSFDGPTTCVSRKKLAEIAGCHDTTMKRGLKALREAGEIEAIAFANGGRERSPVYRISIGLRRMETGGNVSPLSDDESEPETGGNVSPLSEHPEEPKGGQRAPLGGATCSSTGNSKYPPSITSINSLQDKERASRSQDVQEGNNSEVFTYLQDRLKSDLPKEWDNWLSDLSDGGLNGDSYTLFAANKFKSRWVQEKFGNQIVETLREIEPRAARLEVRQIA